MGGATIWQRLLVQTYAHLPRWLTNQVVRLVKGQYPIGVAAVVFDEHGRVLALRHTYGEPKWRLPGGLKDRRETVYETLVREVWEEACCVVAPEWIVEAEPAVYTFDVVLTARLVEERPFRPSAEVVERRWLHPGAFAELNLEQQRYVEAACWLRDRLRT
jgi:8-oxo-dGTP pyrophosphatase MutT (NUDIX family)